MTLEVDPDWWQRIFDDVYLKTDARSVCDDALTAWEVDYLERALELKGAERILDLCGGQGRHALELARRGFGKIVLLDFSAHLLWQGRQAARRENLPVAFVRADARRVPFEPASFDVVLVLGSSFGYFIDDDQNGKILAGAGRLLKPAGRLLLDLADADYVIRHFRPVSRHRVDDDLHVERVRELKEGYIVCRETVRSDKRGLIRQQTYCTRLYTRPAITALLERAGFGGPVFNSGFMQRGGQGDFGTMTSRMVVVARRV